MIPERVSFNLILQPGDSKSEKKGRTDVYKKYSFTVNSMVMNYFNKEKGKNRRNTEEIKRQ